ncbi:hypothetical protein [Bacillus xiapuensis]|nr:hypothetical protein [Bacillus xiapuensis]
MIPILLQLSIGWNTKDSRLVYLQQANKRPACALRSECTSRKEPA